MLYICIRPPVVAVPSSALCFMESQSAMLDFFLAIRPTALLLEERLSHPRRRESGLGRLANRLLH